MKSRGEQLIEAKGNKRKYLSYFLLSFPSFIIIVLGIVMENPLVFLAVASIVGFFQIVIIKNFLDLYYD